MIRQAIICFLVITLFANKQLQAQSEWYITGGSTHFLGDLGGKLSAGSANISDLDLQSSRYMAGAGIRTRFLKYFALRSGVYYAKLSADDKYTDNPARHNRNLNFFSPVFGANAIAEFHFGVKHKISHAYVFAGLEYFHFDPRTRYNGKVVRLQPLGTEGQFFMPGKKPYSLHSVAIPMGVGINLLRREKGYWSFELSARKTFTDYIDDVSTNYVDKTQLLASNGQVAVDLSDRSLGEIPGFSNPGSIRGKPTYNDNFFFLQITYHRYFGKFKFYKSGGSHERGLAPGKKDCYQF